MRFFLFATKPEKFKVPETHHNQKLILSFNSRRHFIWTGTLFCITNLGSKCIDQFAGCLTITANNSSNARNGMDCSMKDPGFVNRRAQMVPP